jgi:hypothetical protein
MIEIVSVRKWGGQPNSGGRRPVEDDEAGHRRGEMKVTGKMRGYCRDAGGHTAHSMCASFIQMRQI